MQYVGHTDREVSSLSSVSRVRGQTEGRRQPWTDGAAGWASVSPAGGGQNNNSSGRAFAVNGLLHYCAMTSPVGLQWIAHAFWRVEMDTSAAAALCCSTHIWRSHLELNYTADKISHLTNNLKINCWTVAGSSSYLLSFLQRKCPSSWLDNPSAAYAIQSMLICFHSRTVKVRLIAEAEMKPCGF